MSRTILVQPGARGRISGGYLYNAKMGAHGAWDLLDADLEDLPARLDNVEHGLVLADSIWLTEERILPFLDNSPELLRRDAVVPWQATGTARN